MSSVSSRVIVTVGARLVAFQSSWTGKVGSPNIRLVSIHFIAGECCLLCLSGAPRASRELTISSHEILTYAAANQTREQLANPRASELDFFAKKDTSRMVLPSVWRVEVN